MDLFSAVIFETSGTFSRVKNNDNDNNKARNISRAESDTMSEYRIIDPVLYC